MGLGTARLTIRPSASFSVSSPTKEMRLNLKLAFIGRIQYAKGVDKNKKEIVHA
jgi:hypothetical protein